MDFSKTEWPVIVGRATTSERQKMIQDLARGVHRVLEDDGREVDLSPPPSSCEPAALPPFAVRDQHGRVLANAAPPATPEPPRVKRGFSLTDREAFEHDIADESEENKTSLRSQFDRLRAEHGIA